MSVKYFEDDDIQNLLISIIIPVYNVQDYIEKCLYSVLNQDIPSETYEIIVVNDGSVDGSLSIILRLADKHPNIKVIDQDNQGLSGARNSGLAVAKGEYVWFIDSDDWIKKNCLKTLLNISQRDSLDLLLINLIHVNIEGKTLFRHSLPDFKDQIVTGTQLYRNFHLGWNVVRYIYRRNILIENNLCFEPGILFEDGEFLDRMFYYVKRVKVYDEVVYFYFQRTGSIVNSLGNMDKRQDSFYILAQKSIQFADKINDKTYIALLQKRTVSYICQYMNYQTYTHRQDFRKKLKELLPLSLEDRKISTIIRLFMITYLPLFYAWIMRWKDELKRKIAII